MTYDIQRLTQFIRRYHLEGVTENTLIYVENERLETTFCSENELLYGKIVWQNVHMPSAKVGIFNTSNFLKTLSVLTVTAAIEFKGEYDDGSVRQMIIRDGNGTTVKLAGAHSKILHLPKTSIAASSFDAQVPLTKALITKILKCLQKVDEDVAYQFIVFRIQDNQLLAVFGFNEMNEIEIALPAAFNYSFSYPLFFVAKYVHRIFKENMRAFEQAHLRLFRKGGMELSFTDKDIVSTYWLKGRQADRYESVYFS